MNKNSTIITVIIADQDKARIAFTHNLLKSVPDINVSRQLTSGNQLISITAKLKPDVILLGIELDDMNSADIIKHIMAFSPVPILILCYNKGCKDIQAASNAMNHGAIDILEIIEEKKGQISLSLKHKMFEAIRVASKIKVVKRLYNIKKPVALVKKKSSLVKKNISKIPFMVGIASSTGGPLVLFNIINKLPAKGFNCTAYCSLVYSGASGLA